MNFTTRRIGIFSASAVTVIAAFLPWMTMGPMGFSGIQVNRGIISAGAAVIVLILGGVFAMQGKKDSGAERYTSAILGLIAAGMAIWTVVEISGAGGGGGGDSAGAKMAQAMMGSMGAGIGAYATIAGGLGMLILPFVLSDD